MKSFIILSLMITLIYAGRINYFKNCSKAVCSTQYAACQNDSGCQETLRVCEQRCTTENEQCLQSCIFSSNSLAVQKLAMCSTSNQCFTSFACFNDITCPTTCKEPAKLGVDQCSSDAAYATWECISEFEKQIGRSDCAAKSCVCNTVASLDIYVVGCYC